MFEIQGGGNMEFQITKLESPWIGSQFKLVFEPGELPRGEERVNSQANSGGWAVNLGHRCFRGMSLTQDSLIPKDAGQWGGRWGFYGKRHPQAPCSHLLTD